MEKVDRSRLDKEQSALTGLRKTYAYIQIGEYCKAQSELDLIGDSQDFQKQIAYFQGYLAYSEGDLNVRVDVIFFVTNSLPLNGDS